jgi:GH43 family beta-xylosidase
MLKTEDIRIRDPFIYADPQTQTYYMYASMPHGVGVYTGRDLEHWNKVRRVLAIPKDSSVQAVWAPEMHEYKGRYYLFVTLTDKATLPLEQPVDKQEWPDMKVRGTHIFYADSPLGPFRPFKQTSYTPEDWMALDGTLFVENGTPYMVFCHEWVQTIDGTIDAIQLKDDLSDTVGESKRLFKASDAPDARKDPQQSKVTDGCFFYRSPQSGRLFMIWSTFIPGKKYCVVLTHSESGMVRGPWKKQTLLYTQNGGHGMIFRTFDNRLLLALHQPNSGGNERLHLFRIVDNGKTLAIQKEELPLSEK